MRTQQIYTGQAPLSMGLLCSSPSYHHCSKRLSSVTLLYLFSSELALKPVDFNPGFVCVCFFVSSVRTVWTTALRQEDETQERSTLQHSERATWITLSGKKYRKNSSKRRKIGVSKVTHRCSITDKSNPGWWSRGGNEYFKLCQKWSNLTSKQAEVQSSFNPSRNQLKGREITTMAT